MNDVINLAKENGYDVTIVHVVTDLDKALERNLESVSKIAVNCNHVHRPSCYCFKSLFIRLFFRYGNCLRFCQ